MKRPIVFVIGFLVVVALLATMATAKAYTFEQGEQTVAYHACFDPTSVADRMAAAASIGGAAVARAMWIKDAESEACVILPPLTIVAMQFQFGDVLVRDLGFRAEAWAFTHPSFGQTMYGAWRVLD